MLRSLSLSYMNGFVYATHTQVSDIIMQMYKKLIVARTSRNVGQQSDTGNGTLNSEKRKAKTTRSLKAQQEREEGMVWGSGMGDRGVNVNRTT
jgi:hypothetical protein